MLRAHPPGDSAKKNALTFSWREVWSKPGPPLTEVAQRGEMLVARLRLILVLVVCLIPLTAYLAHPVLPNRIGLAVGASAAVLAFLLLYLVRKGWFPSGIALFSSLVDVTLVTSALLAFVALGLPAIAVNSRIIYPIYFLAIMATSLRYDSRVCIVAGATAIVQYALVTLLALAYWTTEGAAAYGGFDGLDQVGRMILLGIAATLCALSVVRSRQLLVLSTRDLLTGLFNRGFFDERLQEEVERGKRLYRPVTLAMLDLDHFKDFNDSQGHRAGDELLETVARSLRDFFRSADTVARYGGDEFAIIVAESGPAEVAARLDDFRRTVQALIVPLAEPLRRHGVTISIGLASWPRDGQTAEDVLICADKRLYDAKRHGGNEVVAPPSLADVPHGSAAAQRPS